MQLRGEKEKAAHSLSTRHTQRVPGTGIDQFNFNFNFNKNSLLF
jgi:hypothetical protein